jgi:hypothetical protein
MSTAADPEEPRGDEPQGEPKRYLPGAAGEAVDPESGEVVKIKPDLPAPPALRAQIALRQGMPKLDTAVAVYAELERELWKLDLLGRRLTEVHMLIHGYYTDDGDYVAGAKFEYANEYDKLVAKLYADSNDTKVPKENRPKWPGQDVRTSLVNQQMDPKFLQRMEALEGERKSLLEYRRITEQRASSLQSLLAFRREEAVMAGRYPPRSGQEGQ